jgi:hypothetical protein
MMAVLKLFKGPCVLVLYLCWLELYGREVGWVARGFLSCLVLMLFSIVFRRDLKLYLERKGTGHSSKVDAERLSIKSDEDVAK